MKLCLTVQHALRLDLNYGSETLLVKTKAVLDHHGIYDQVEQWGIENEYHSGLDWVLCVLMPEQKPPCLQFYAGKGEPMRKLYTRRQNKAIDLQLSRLVYVLIKKLMEGTT